ncbi:hypothetical protein DMA11_23935, partial [Marinilabiliaceae bacterium JC017]
METLRDKWRYIETDRNILKQPVLSKEQSQLPIDEKSLHLSTYHITSSYLLNKYEKGHDVGKRGSQSNKRAGDGATKMNAGILACGLAKIHQGGGEKL